MLESSTGHTHHELGHTSPDVVPHGQSSGSPDARVVEPLDGVHNPLLERLQNQHALSPTRPVAEKSVLIWNHAENGRGTLVPGSNTLLLSCQNSLCDGTEAVGDGTNPMVRRLSASATTLSFPGRWVISRSNSDKKGLDHQLVVTAQLEPHSIQEVTKVGQ